MNNVDAFIPGVVSICLSVFIVWLCMFRGPDVRAAAGIFFFAGLAFIFYSFEMFVLSIISGGMAVVILICVLFPWKLVWGIPEEIEKADAEVREAMNREK